MGALYDSRAPWNNWTDNMVKCEACGGTGSIFYAYNFITHQEKECSEKEWNNLPETEFEALAMNGQFVRDGIEVCEMCGGEGEVEREPYDKYDKEFEYEDKYV